MDRMYESLEKTNEKRARALRAAVDDLKLKKRIMETQYTELARARDKLSAAAAAAKGPIEYYTKQITIQKEKLRAEEAVYESKTEALESQRRAVNREFDDKIALLESKRKTALGDIDDRLAILKSKRTFEKSKRESTIAQCNCDIEKKIRVLPVEPTYPPTYYKIDAEIAELESKIRAEDVMTATYSYNADEAREKRLAQMREEARKQDKEMREAAEAAELAKAIQINTDRKAIYQAEKRRNEERYAKQSVVEKQQHPITQIIELFVGSNDDSETDSNDDSESEAGRAADIKYYTNKTRGELHKMFTSMRKSAVSYLQRNGKSSNYFVRQLNIMKDILETKFSVEVELP